MLKKTLAFCLAIFVAAEAYAFDSNYFYKALTYYSAQQVNCDQLLKQVKKTGDYDAYEKAMSRQDKAADIVISMIDKISTKTEVDVCKYLIQKFRNEAPEHAKAARMAKKMLTVKSNYITVDPTMRLSRLTTAEQKSLKEIWAEICKEESIKLEKSLNKNK